jgi:outer membrane protein assembly factor BamB
MRRFVWTLAVWCLTQSPSQADDWPQWLGPKRDGVWRETGILTQFPNGGPKIRWRTPLGGGYAGPAVADGRVYVTDRVLPEGVNNPADPFGKTRVEGKERVLSLDEATGKILWNHEYPCDYAVSYPAGPRATPTVDGSKVYTLGTMGDLLCLETATGKVLWSKNFPRDYQAPIPEWGFAAHPLVDGDKLICLAGGQDSLVIALHKDTGKELWRALSASEPGYSPPMIYEFGGQRQLIVWNPDSINGLNPETGSVYWSQPFKVRAGLSIPTPRKAGDLLFVTSFYNGPLMLKFQPNMPKPAVLWKGKSQSEQSNRTDGLHSIMPTPFIKDGYIYGVCSYGQLRCLKAGTGERVWETFEATGGKEERWGNAFLIEQDDHFFLFNEKGDLIIARLSPKEYKEIDRAHILEPTNKMAGRLVVWSHPAFANQSMYARNDKEIVCVALAAKLTESQFFEAAQEGTAGQAECPGCLGLVTVGSRQRSHQALSFPTVAIGALTVNPRGLDRVLHFAVGP